MTERLPEHWLRGPVDGVPALLQPAAHALLQAVEETKEILQGFPAERLWDRPAGVASVGFHLLHLAGVLDRLCTYAQGRPLTEAQLAYLRAESEPQPLTTTDLLQRLQAQVHHTLERLKATPEGTLTDVRTVGRKALPSTVQGLLFHAAEHTMRHLGQLLVTARVLKNSAAHEE